MNGEGGGPPGGGNPGGFGQPPGGQPPGGGGFGQPPGGQPPGGGFGRPPGQPPGGQPPGGGFGQPPGQPPGGGGFGPPPGQPPGGGGFGQPPGQPPGGGGFGRPPGQPPPGQPPPGQPPPGQPPGGGGGFGRPPGQPPGGFGSQPGGGFGGPPPRPPKKKRGPLFYALVLAPFALCCFGGIALITFGAIEAGEYDALKPACDGAAVASAPAYAPGGTAQAVGFERSSSSSWILHHAFIPRTRRADEVGDASAVVCVEDQTEERLERCAYTVGSSANAIDRYRYQRQVRLVAVSTGQVIASTVVYGTEPAACEEWEAFSGGGTTLERRGEEVTDDAISAWVLTAL